jgi:hypothetical protein
VAGRLSEAREGSVQNFQFKIQNEEGDERGISSKFSIQNSK